MAIDRQEPSPQIAVVVPVRDAAETIDAALAAIAAQVGVVAFEVVVVDDGSGDGTPDLIAARHPAVRLIRRASGLGAGSARNEGARATGAPLIAFTDADCEPAPDWLRSGVEALADADLVQGAVEPLHEPEGAFDRTVRSNRPGLFETANLLVRRDLFESLGGFEDWIVRGESGARPIGEDVWFGWSATRAGARVKFDPSVLVRHAVFAGHASTYVGERLRLRYFPQIVRRIPELRSGRLYAGVFLSRRSALFDLALLGAGFAAVTRSKLPLAALVPYSATLTNQARRSGKRRVLLVGGVDLIADAVGFGSLLTGSIRQRVLVI